MKLLAGLLLFTGLGFAAGWTGTLVDADCKDVHKDQACPVDQSTKHYGIVRDGAAHHYYRIDTEGDVKVAAALADQQKKTGRFPEGGNIKVWFTGAPNGNRIALKDFALK